MGFVDRPLHAGQRSHSTLDLTYFLSTLASTYFSTSVSAISYLGMQFDDPSSQEQLVVATTISPA